MIIILVPLRTVSEANTREHWAPRAKRAKLQRTAAASICSEYYGKVKPPVRVTLVRIGKRKLDSDNLAGSFKHVQDGVADALRVDDGDDSKVLWRYRQEIGKDYAVRIEIEQCACVAKPPARDGATGYYDSSACPVHRRQP